MSTSPAASEGYSALAKIFHWAIAVAVIVMIPAGVIMMRIGPGEAQNMLYNLHRSLGAAVLLLMALRLAWRLVHGAPAPLPTLNAFERAASAVVHRLLYALLLVQPVIGWAATSAFGAPIVVFGLFRLPDFVAKNEALSKQLFALHNVIGLTLAALIALHVAAALYHHFIRRDGVLRRMLP